MNLTRKILQAHLVEGSLDAGAPIAIRIDQTLTQDATGTMACLQFETLQIPRVKTELSVSYVDHNSVQIGFENADDHRYLQSVAARYGMHFSRPGNGICHQVHLERFGAPGKTLLGSDSHTPTGGGLCMIAIGAGGLDVAVAMGGGPYHLVMPKVIGVRLTGRLRPGVAAKDVVLHMLSLLTTRGNVNTCLEYFGPGAGTLEVPDRATITNMGAEMGVTFSLFPSDAATRRFLEAQRRPEVFVPLAADEGAAYDRVIDVDLAALEPLVAAPHSPDKIQTVQSCEAIAVQQVCIGSCTNSSLRDLETAAAILGGQPIHPDVSLVVTPGSKQVLMAITRSGAMEKLLASGARFIEPSCSFCIGNCASPGSGQVSVRTINRNFEGRSGTKDAQVYLASVETAALCALNGRFVDPTTLPAAVYAGVKVPDRYAVDDRMIIPPIPGKEAAAVAIQRGPNIGAPPYSEALADALACEVTLKVGDNITTDHIMPAGARLKYRSNIPKYAEFVFEGVDPTFPKRCLENRGRKIGNVVVAGQSYGQGSSREHAAVCPMYLGVKAILAVSIERIHLANLVNFGILPLTFKDPADLARVNPGDRLELSGLHAGLNGGGGLVVRNATGGFDLPVSLALDPRQAAILLAGGLLNHTQSGRPGRPGPREVNP